MKAYVLPLLLMMLAGCIPIDESTNEKPGQGLGQGQGEVVESVTGTGGTLNIIERLLPSGLIEIGDRDAPVVLMMFTEHHCRYCKQFFREQFPRLHKEFIVQGKLRLQIGILPLRKYIHSISAAKGLHCAATQGNGIPMHELLFELGAKSRESLISQAVTLELDTELFSQCLDSPDTVQKVEQQKSFARALNISRVPTFFLNGEKSVGLPYYADLKGMIEEQLAVGN